MGNPSEVRYFFQRPFDATWSHERENGRHYVRFWVWSNEQIPAAPISGCTLEDPLGEDDKALLRDLHLWDDSPRYDALRSYLLEVCGVARDTLRGLSWPAVMRLLRKAEGSAGAAEGFSFRPGQALYDGKDLAMPTGATLEVFNRLVANLGRPVRYDHLDDQSRPSDASELLRATIVNIRRRLRVCTVPYKIVNKRGEAYSLERVKTRSLSEYSSRKTVSPFITKT
jgi:hypothetical protein